MNLLGFGGENSFYLCSDTPVGIRQISFQVLDGLGGVVEIAQLSRFAPAARWSGFQMVPILTVMGSSISWMPSSRCECLVGF